MNRWLARFSFSFFIIALVLVWEGYQTLIGNNPGVPQWRIGLYFIAAIFSFVLGGIGVRERHRSDDQQPRSVIHHGDTEDTEKKTKH